MRNGVAVAEKSIHRNPELVVPINGLDIMAAGPFPKCMPKIGNPSYKSHQVSCRMDMRLNDLITSHVLTNSASPATNPSARLRDSARRFP